MDRRTFISATAAAGIAGLAGCSDLNPLSSEGPDDVVESYIEAEFELAEENPWEELDEYEHSVHQDDDDDDDEDDEFELLEIETEVTEEDLNEDEFANHAGWGLDDDDIEEIVENEETALVEATVTYEQDGDEEEEERDFLLATDEGDWKIVNMDH